jgi:LacI family gluconate utilization system Gnt-I transcriptional repressor
MAIAGSGDFEIASQVVPMLTTVRVPRHEIGRKAAEMLIRRFRGEEIEVTKVDMAIEIVQRDST